MRLIKPLLTLSFLFIILICLAQENTNKPIDGSLTIFSIGYGVDLPIANLKDRFGENLKFTIGGEHISAGNWIYNVDFFFLFGTKIKEDVLASFRTREGFILGDDGLYADVFLRQRGLFLGAGMGRLFQLKEDSRSGIKLLLNAGILQHNIR